MKKLFLDDLENVMEILVCFEKFLTDGASLEDLGFMYCSSCREECRMHIGITHYEKTVLHKQVVFKKLGCRLLEATDEAAFLTYACVNCLRHYWAYFHRTQEDDLALRVLPSHQPMLSTANTPEAVAYYLEQAYLAQLVGAHSAAMGMYRSALDNFLDGNGKLEKRIEDLAKQVENGSAPRWARTLNARILTLIKEIGDTHMHANALTDLQNLNTDKLHRVQALMSHLLKQKYELEADRKAALAKVHQALANSQP